MIPSGPKPGWVTKGRSQMSDNITRDLTLELEGCAKAVPFRHAVSKGKDGKGGGNSYWAVLRTNPTTGERFNSKFGVKVKPLGKNLPKSVTIVDPETGESVKVTLKLDTVPAEGDTPSRSKMVGSAKVTLPGLGVERNFRATISNTQDGNWNLKVAATNFGGGGAEAVDVDDL